MIEFLLGLVVALATGQATVLPDGVAGAGIERVLEWPCEPIADPLDEQCYVIWYEDGSIETGP